MAWFALTNSNAVTAPNRSPSRTRPGLLIVSRALRAAPGSHAAAGQAPVGPRWLTHQGDGPHRVPPAPPSCESTGPSARTPSRDRRDYALRAPAPPFGAGIPAHTVHDSWASWLSFTFPTPPLSTKPGQLHATTGAVIPRRLRSRSSVCVANC